MIKAEVIFIEDRIIVGRYVIEVDPIWNDVNIWLNDNIVKICTKLEDAIKYCLEH